MAASMRYRAWVIFLLVFLIAQKISITPASAQCTDNSLLAGFSSCVDLQPSTFAWTYFGQNSSASIAYTDTALSTSGWVGWGINFNGTSMVNSNALIAFNQPNGTSSVLLYKLTSAVYDDSSVPLTPVSSFDLQVVNISTVISGTSFTIFATIQLPTGLTTLNLVYNRGPSVTNDIPVPHGTGQRNGMRTIDMTTGSVTASEAPHQKLKNLHGALAAVSWGVILIIGAMVARYLRPFPIADPAWFYIHVFLQTSAYVLGVTAWAIGLRLGVLTPGVYHDHRSIGIAVFTLATVQVLALFVRPHTEHKFRMYWNIYHHALGYTVIVLGVINIFKGFNILKPANKYKALFITFIVLAACASLGLEVLMWIHVFRKRREKQRQQSQQPADGYAMNGSGTSALYGSAGGTQSYAAAGRPKWDSEF